MDLSFYVISTRRPKNVKPLQNFAGPCFLTWVVGEGEESSYRAEGAMRCLSTRGLVPARNLALDDAFSKNAVCVQLSDDLRRVDCILDLAHKNASALQKNLKLPDALQYLLLAQKATQSKLVGVPPTANPLNVREAITKNKFVIGDFFACWPTNLRFDPNLRLKEDYDFTLQHIKKYGVVARAEQLLCSFQHYKNSGGAVDIRTTALEQLTIAYLKQKWPEVIRDNPKRPNEILINPRKMF